MTFCILVVDDEDNFCDGIKTYLQNKGYDVRAAANLTDARTILKSVQIDIILLDVQIGKEYGPDLLYDIRQIRPNPKTILITAFGEIEMAVDAMRSGAFDFLSKPVNFLMLEKRLKHAEDILRMEREIEHFQQEPKKPFSFVMGQSVAVKKVFKDAGRAATANVSVLINGETGTGKEIVAKYIHKIGTRSQKPMIAINCAAIQPTVLESELFGHEAGAFTGAIQKKPGLMEIADGGIVFLDEISSMGLEMQSKILRAIEEKKIRRVGGTKEISVDVQIIAASNRDLQKMIEQLEFRADLYYRLRVVVLDLPSLRERKEDIPEITGFFIRTLSPELGLNVTGVSDAVLQAFKMYKWPGNIRELRNVIESAMIYADSEKIEICDLPAEIAHLAA